MVNQDLIYQLGYLIRQLGLRWIRSPNWWISWEWGLSHLILDVASWKLKVNKDKENTLQKSMDVLYCMEADIAGKGTFLAP